MAIYTGGMRMQDEARAASKRIAAQQAKAEKGESKRKGRAGIFGKLAGLGIGQLAGWALAPLTGGLVNPLTIKLAQAAISGGSMFAGKAAAHQATTGKWGKQLKTSGQVDKIEAGGKYGYGREEAKTLSEGLTESRESEQDWGTLAGDIIGAGASEFAGESLGSLLKGKTDMASELTGDELNLSSLVSGGEGTMETLASPVDYYDDAVVSEEIFAQGGQVPQMDQQQLMQLLALMSQQQEQTAYSGTPLEEKQQSSIADMFASQGKTLGGNNTQSLSQMLGR